MLSSVTSWWGSATQQPSKPEGTTQEEKPTMTQTEPPEATGTTEGSAPEPVEDPNMTKTTDEEKDTNEASDKENQSPLSMEAIEEQLEEVGAKAINTAKEWGSYLYSFGKTATVTVAKTALETAKQLKDTVEEKVVDKTIIGDFSREHQKFVSENQEKRSKSEAAVPPWVGYNEEEAMKSQILGLSADKRNFLRNPPTGIQFQFDFESSFPVATSMLQEDPNLKKMRFELVPKQVNEENFWRNYFYRVSLIKQSAQLTSLAQETEKSSEKGIPGKKKQKEEEVVSGSSPCDAEFISDDFQEGHLKEEDLSVDLQQLGMGQQSDQPQDDIPDWEKELQAELQEYEVVDDGTGMDDDDLEQEILDQIQAESQES